MHPGTEGDFRVFLHYILLHNQGYIKRDPKSQPLCLPGPRNGRKPAELSPPKRGGPLPSATLPC